VKHFVVVEKGRRFMIQPKQKDSIDLKQKDKQSVCIHAKVIGVSTQKLIFVSSVCPTAKDIHV
jgi:hypothetical protein